MRLSSPNAPEAVQMSHATVVGSRAPMFPLMIGMMAWSKRVCPVRDELNGVGLVSLRSVSLHTEMCRLSATTIGMTAWSKRVCPLA